MENAVSATVRVIGYASGSSNASSFTVTNRTGYTGYYLYISPVSSDRWGSDFLGEKVLPTGQAINIKRSDLLSSSNNTYDIRIVDSDNDSYTKRNVSLINNQNIEFTINDLDLRNSTSNSTDNNRPSIRIQNNTGYTVFYVYISPKSSTSWEEDVLGEDVLLNRNSVSVRLAHPLNVENRYDIRIEDSDGDTYTKWNVLVTQNMTIEFTIRDLD